MGSENDYRRRAEHLSEMFRTPAAARIKEAVERRKRLRADGWPTRMCAGRIALQMDVRAATVRDWLRTYRKNPARYDAMETPRFDYVRELPPGA